jgi:hypothetical protein
MRDGGQAFPTCVSADSEGGLNHGAPGMSLRDYFAGQAIHAAVYMLNEAKHDERKDEQTVAKLCYEMADAMLAERAK